MNKDSLEFYQQIGELLVNAIPEPWTAIEVEALAHESSIDLLVMYDDRVGNKRNIEYVPMLARAFFDLAQAVSDEKKGLYRKCIFKLGRDGDFKADFVY